MAREYALNVEQAKGAGNVGSYIETSGKYVGMFTRAEAIVSNSSGAEGIEFSMKSNQGASVDYLQLWTHDKDGKEFDGPSMKIVSALMTCMKVKAIKPIKARIEKRDNGATVTKEAIIYSELMNKPIGLVLQREEYVKASGQPGYRMLMIAPFEASTELTAGEILGRVTQPEQLGKIISWLSSHMVKQAKARAGNNSGANAYAAGGYGTQQPGGDPLDDDIPF